ncbi:MAG: PAS domain-containing sensor histidine kinase, partial [Alphaproteobacteria bacterium]
MGNMASQVALGMFLPWLEGGALFETGLAAPVATLAAALFWFAVAVWALADRARLQRAGLSSPGDGDDILAMLARGSDGFLLSRPDGSIVAGGVAGNWIASIDGDDPAVPTAEVGLLDTRSRARLLERLADPSPFETMLVPLADGRTLLAFEPDGIDVTAIGATRIVRLLEIGQVRGPGRHTGHIGMRPHEAAGAFPAILDAVPFPMWIRNRELELIAVNAAYVRAVEEASADNVVARQLELVTNALTGSTRDSARRALEKGAPGTERHFAVVGGQRRALAVSDIPLDDRVIGFAIDITDAEELRAELARVVEGHSETLNRLSSPVAIFDAEQRLRFSNSAFARLFRLSEEWLAEHPDHASLLEAMRERRRLPEQADFRAWKNRQLDLYQSPEPVEDMWHLPDGTTLRAVTQPHPLGGLLVFYEDVTDRLALEGSYNTLIAVQRETLNNLHEAVAVYGSDARLKLYNPNYARIWNLDPDYLDSEPHFGEILDHARALLDTSGDWAERKAQLLGQLTERESRSGRWHRPDGKVLDYALVPLPDGRMLTTHIDVTDSFRIEQALRERNEALETADRLKSEFVANMSYELRTPLNTIIGFSELLDGGIAGTLGDKQRDYIHYVLTAAGQLRDLIDNILDLAVIEAGAMSLDIVEVPIEALLDDVLALSREQARKAGLEVLVKTADDCGTIECDQRRLKQAIYNLVTNAIKFTPRGGRLTLLARPAGEDEVEIIVRDTGIGIDEKERVAVFEKFYTGSSAS